MSRADSQPHANDAQWRAVLQECVVTHFQPARLQVSLAQSGLGRDQSGVRHGKDDTIGIGQLPALRIDAVIVGLRMKM